jgi:CPA1 family monovalent cation:H+ antiporter
MRTPTKTRSACAHVSDAVAEPRSQTCEECGSDNRLRMCTECGHVGCCESQQGHNTAHARASGHPIIKQFPVVETSFTWCYACNSYLEDD